MEKKIVNPAQIHGAMTFEAYWELSQHLFAEGKTTSEADNYNTAEILEYTKVNLARSRRLLKTVVLTEAVQQAMAGITEAQDWYILTESWCGDAAQIVPVIAQVAEANPLVKLQLVLRDKNLELMDQFLTNGGRSIPKLIITAASNHEMLASWGPRPAAAQELVLRLKAENVPFSELAEQLHGWYAQDKTQHTQAELAEVVRLSY